jgi:hypothetical protein
VLPAPFPCPSCNRLVIDRRDKLAGISRCRIEIRHPQQERCRFLTRERPREGRIRMRCGFIVPRVGGIYNFEASKSAGVAIVARCRHRYRSRFTSNNASNERHNLAARLRRVPDGIAAQDVPRGGILRKRTVPRSRGERWREADRGAAVNVCRLPRGNDKRQRRYRGGAVIPLRREFVTRVARWFMVISSLLERHFRCLNRPRFALARSYISYPIPRSIGGSVTPFHLPTHPSSKHRLE